MQNTPAGAKAFVRYWFEAANFAIRTGDTEVVEAIASAGCGSCQELIRSVHGAYADGGRIKNGRLLIKQLKVDPGVRPPVYRFAVELRQEPKTEVDAAGRTVRRETGASAVFITAARWTGGFKFLGLERLDD
jgi:hypothetical protein